MNKFATCLSIATCLLLESASAIEVKIQDKGYPKAYVYFKDKKVTEIRQQYREPLDGEEAVKYYGGNSFGHTFSKLKATCGFYTSGSRAKDYDKNLCDSKFSESSVVGELGGRVIITAMTAGIATAVLGTLHSVKYNPTKLKEYIGDSDFDAYSQLVADGREFVVISDFDYEKFIEQNNIKTNGALTNIKTSAIVYDSVTKKNLFIDTQKSTQELVNEWMGNLLKPREPKAVTLPKEIEKPTLPKMPTLVKDEFETKAEFEARVNKAMSAREEAIAALQQKYRKDVEDRNIEVEKLKKAYQEEIAQINAEQEAKKEKLAPTIEHYTKLALLFSVGRPNISNPAYDAESQTMYVNFDTKKGSSKVAFKIKPQEAKELKTKFDKTAVEARYEYLGSSFGLKGIEIAFGGEKYQASLTDKEFQPETIKVKLEDKKVEFNSEQQAKMFALQNPNLIDKYQITPVEINALGAKKYNDDLTPLVRTAKASTPTPNKWLFAIAVENYAEADPVIFAKNSAEAFVSAAKKRFGIDDRHTYAYIDDKATGSGIKNNLERLLENVKEGDTVYFYYSGHGIPSPIDGEAFILPRDAIADYITREKDFMARNIYKKLSDSKAGKVFAFVDSCYSGKTDNVSNIKGVAAGHFRTKKVEFDTGKMTVITAGTNGQFSNAYNEKGHRLFTYYLTKAIIERPTLSVESLYQEVALKVKDESFKKGDTYRQEPQIEGNTKLEL
ncbi:MAG: caspase family protein [Campylobacterales bacterium]